MSFTNRYPSSSLVLASSAMTTLRVLSVVLVLLACRSGLAAQSLTQRLAGRDPAWLGSRLPSGPAGARYRIWLSNSRSDLGGAAPMPWADGGADGAIGAIGDRTAGPQAWEGGAVSAVTLGLRYRLTSKHALFADAARVRGLGAGLAGVDYGAKVGVEWQPAQSTFGIEHGALGMQMAAGYKLSLKVRRGGPNLYLRSQF